MTFRRRCTGGQGVCLCGMWKKGDPSRRKSWCKGAKAGPCLGELEELQGGGVAREGIRGETGANHKGPSKPSEDFGFNLEGDGSQRGVLGSFNKTRHDLTYILKGSLWLVGGE